MQTQKMGGNSYCQPMKLFFSQDARDLLAA